MIMFSSVLHIMCKYLASSYILRCKRSGQFLDTRGAGGGKYYPSRIFAITHEPHQLSTRNLQYLLLHQFDMCCENFDDISRKKGENDSFITLLHAIFGQNQAIIQTATSPLFNKQFQIVEHQKTKNIQHYLKFQHFLIFDLKIFKKIKGKENYFIFFFKYN